MYQNLISRISTTINIFLKIENTLHGHAVSTEQKTTCTKLKQYRMYDNVWKLRLFY